MCHIALPCYLLITSEKPPVGNEGVECETRSVGTNNKMTGGPDQTENVLGRENQ
jgi:hypothetical protein